MAINFKVLVESQLVLEQFDPSKSFKSVIIDIFKKLYKTEPPDKLFSDYFIDGGQRLFAGGGYKIDTDEVLKSKRYYWPILDIAYLIITYLNIPPANFTDQLLTKSLDDILNDQIFEKYSATDKISISNNIIQIIDEFAKYNNPQDYTQFNNYRLRKLSTDLSQLTIQRYNNLPILNAITEIAALRGIKDKNLIKKTLTTPINFLQGRQTLPKDFDSAIVNIGGSLLNYFKLTKQSVGILADVLKDVGTIAGQNTPYGKEFTTFIETKKLSDLQSEAPDIYAKIQEYTLHIKRGDKLTGWQIAGNMFSGVLKGLEDIGNTLSKL